MGNLLAHMKSPHCVINWTFSHVRQHLLHETRQCKALRILMGSSGSGGAMAQLTKHVLFSHELRPLVPTKAQTWNHAPVILMQREEDPCSSVWTVAKLLVQGETLTQ